MKRLFIVLTIIGLLFLTSCGEEKETKPDNTVTTNVVVENQQPIEEQNTSGFMDTPIFNEDGNLISVRILFEFLQNAEPSFKLIEKAADILDTNEEAFLKNDNSELEDMTDYSIDSKMLKKNIDKYGDKFIYVEDAFVIAINEETIENLTISTIQVSNQDGDIYYIYSLNAHDDIFDEDMINIYALPIGRTSYENISGGSTHAVVLARVYIEKTE